MTSHRRRPLIRWHGGKWKWAKWIIGFFPPHDTYVEPFGGGASVLLQKRPAKAECYNDLDETLIQLFRVLQDPAQAERLVRLLEFTPFSRAEFDLANGADNRAIADPVEAARRTIIRSFMGYGSDGTAGLYRTGFRRTVTQARKFPAKEWATYPDALRFTIERFQSVVLEQCDAFKLMPELDKPGTLFYVDPPYHPDTRSKGNRRRGAGFHVYKHELVEADHPRLLESLLALSGMVVLSGYPHPLYDEMLPGWLRFERDAYADGGRHRKEALWLNPAVQHRLSEERLTAARRIQPRLLLEDEFYD
jgi:DNA adenine methylase